MPVHAFIDESGRGRVYLVCVTIVDPAALPLLRKKMRELLLPGEREIHFKKQKEQRRRVVADAVARLDVTARVYSTACPVPKQEETARQRCLTRLIDDLLAQHAHRVVFDSREQRDVHDKHTVQSRLGERPSKTELVYEHVNSRAEELLWISDVIAWCYGAGGQWRQRVAKVIDEVVEL